MRWIVGAIFLMLFLIIRTRKRRVRARHLKRTLKKIARTRGFKLKRDWLFRATGMKGIVGGKPVELKFIKIQRHWYWDYQVEMDLPRGIQVEWKAREVQRGWFGSRQEIVDWSGDADFDARFEQVVGNTAFFPTQAIRRLLTGFPEIKKVEWLSGEMHLHQDAEATDTRLLVEQGLDALQGVRDLPSFEKDPIKQWKQNYLLETDERIRMHLLDQAAKVFSKQGMREFLKWVLNEGSLESRAVVADLLGTEGLDIFLKSAPDLSVLLEFPSEILLRLIRALGREKKTDSFYLLQLLTESRQADFEVRKSALGAMSLFETTQSREFLEKTVKEGEVELKLCAIEFLASCGTVESVEVLYEFSNALLPGRLRKASRQAMAQIQSGLGSVERGWISMYEHADLSGALSDADLDGAISLHEESEVNGVEG